jgi:hypothetical protein
MVAGLDYDAGVSRRVDTALSAADCAHTREASRLTQVSGLHGRASKRQAAPPPFVTCGFL